MTQPPLPSTLPPYPGIGLSDIRLVATEQEAQEALTALMRADVLGFDTESKPTFVKGEVSRGPHLIQLADETTAYLFQVGDDFNAHVVRTVLESPTVLKAGFGLSDDLKRLQGKLGIHTQNVIDLSSALRAAAGSRNDIGAKTAVALFFGMYLQKSKKTTTTNWAAARLSERQILYAADDAQVALRIYRAWQAGKTS